MRTLARRNLVSGIRDGRAWGVKRERKTKAQKERRATKFELKEKDEEERDEEEDDEEERAARGRWSLLAFHLLRRFSMRLARLTTSQWTLS